MNLRNDKAKESHHPISDAERTSIETGISDAENGNIKPLSEAKKIYGKWL